MEPIVPKENPKACMIWNQLERALDDRGAFNGWDDETMADARKEMIEHISMFIPED